MPTLPAWQDRLREAIRPKNINADDGDPAMEVLAPDGFALHQRSASNAAQTLVTAQAANRKPRVLGYAVTLHGLGAVTAGGVTINLLGSGGAVIWQEMVPSGTTPDKAGFAKFNQDFRLPIPGESSGTVGIYVGPAGASLFSIANLYGDLVS